MNARSGNVQFFCKVQGNLRHYAVTGGSVRGANYSADWRRNCGKGSFMDGKLLTADIHSLSASTVFPCPEYTIHPIACLASLEAM